MNHRALVSGVRFIGSLALVFFLSSAMSMAAKIELVWSAPGSAEEFAVYERVGKEFAAENPDINVVVTSDKKQAALILAGQSPDIIFSTIEDFPSLHNQGIALNIQSYVNRDQFDWQDFFPTILNPYRFDGQQYGVGDLYGLPKETAIRALYFNSTAFAKAGLPSPMEQATRGSWNWLTFLTAAKRLTQDINGDGSIDQYGFAEDTKFGRWMPWIWSNGGTVVDNPFKPTKATVTDPKTVEGMDFFAALERDHKVFRKWGNNEFAAGKVAMFANGRWDVPKFRTIKGFDWDVAPRPTGPAGRAQLLTGSAFMVSSQSRQPEAAWKLLKYITSKRGQALMTELGLLLPSRISVGRSEFMGSHPPQNNAVFLDEINYAQPQPMLPTWTKVNDDITKILDSIRAGKIATASAAIQINDALNNAIRQAQVR